MAKKTISPGGSVSGVVELPGDKSISHRYAILAALAEGASEIRELLFGSGLPEYSRLFAETGS